MDILVQDLRYCVRMLKNQLGFSVLIILTLALAIGANTAIFSIVNAVLLRPLPYKDPDKLVMIWQTWPQKGYQDLPVFIPDYLYWREQNQTFDEIAAFQNREFNLTEIDGEPDRLLGMRATANFFPTLGVNPLLGRTFLPPEDQFAANQVVVLSHSLWQRKFGANPQVIGKTIALNNAKYTIIGVMPKDFQFSVTWGEKGKVFPKIELWVPMGFSNEELTSYSGHDITVLGRLKSDISLPQAQAQMDQLANNLQQLHPEINAGVGVLITSLSKQLTGNMRLSLLILLGAVAFLLLIACVNVANLLLVRASARQTEISIRAALGATRTRIIRQLLTENLFLGLLSGIVGLVITFWSSDLLVSLSPIKLHDLHQVKIDLWVLGFTFAISIFTGLLFGLIPALQTSKPDLNRVLKEGGRGASEGANRQRWRNVLTVAEISLALVLLIGAGLLIKSFLCLQGVNPGFKTDKLVTMQLALPASKYGESFQKAAFLQQLVKQVASLPEVKGAAVSSNIPMESSWGTFFVIEGRTATTVRETPLASNHAVSPDYFRLLGIPLIKGRYFAEQDNQQSSGVAIISRSLAQRYWAEEDAIGKRIKRGSSADSEYPWLTIVGVVDDVRQLGLDAQPEAELYLSYAQTPRSVMTLIVETALNANSTALNVRNELQNIDKEQPIYNIRTMDEILSETLAPRRFSMILLACFAGLALLLATLGIYGVIAYSVVRRSQEIGIRMALGAKPRDIFKLIIGQGMALALVGIGLGLIISLSLTSVMANMLYGISTTDPATYGLISLIFMLVVQLACLIPARRAIKLDPMAILRSE